MNIVYYSSDLFSEMCGVAIQSLCENNKDADDINIYVVEDNISDENKKRLNNIVQHFSRKIFFIKKPEQKDLYPEVKYDLGQVIACFIKLLRYIQETNQIASFPFCQLKDTSHFDFLFRFTFGCFIVVKQKIGCAISVQIKFTQ